MVGLLLVFDVTRRQTFEGLEAWLAEVGHYASSPRVARLLVGHKAEAADAADAGEAGAGASRGVSAEEAAAFAATHSMAYAEASAKTAAGVQAAFETLVLQALQNAIATPSLHRLTPSHIPSHPLTHPHIPSHTLTHPHIPSHPLTSPHTPSPLYGAARRSWHLMLPGHNPFQAQRGVAGCTYYGCTYYVRCSETQLAAFLRFARRLVGGQFRNDERFEEQAMADDASPPYNSPLHPLTPPHTSPPTRLHR